jgi:hypothetical protein
MELDEDRGEGVARLGAIHRALVVALGPHFEDRLSTGPVG